ncbi:hypothetical protein M501DRAFT_593067 [Patellaria atrata CBS 101060]|uniref:Uncharacterized protein n=1 Tax=Patellaria atrata CBS 101060 TaxID=1346257 RepID=A0A9P4S2R5_9PEZI|nr:hypothetical protein M501DRAFT_593067 [Patellaria atrata CBS 101060]
MSSNDQEFDRSERYGQGTGFGNRTSSEGDFSEEHANTRFGSATNKDSYSGATEYGSGTTAGVGYGNKKVPDSDEVDNSDTRFGSHTNTDPYSDSTGYGSGTTGGAGFGNKTGSFSRDESSQGGKNDSTMGKVMEKVGSMMHKDNIKDKGHEKREKAGAFHDDDTSGLR